ncbi:MAG: short chain dehydrogenase [Deltaproteobacteria bacterium HGW-Deltaproteobacteria-13]|jgi:NADP-dependent 3-hydroxy acid dehydrogenase YdfG|nr:MAG: short chain dehydrogenase [Deltaproteobacteria bacterium HGW-Deltaproteobacteria-13]
MKAFPEKKVLITGAASGIGRSTAQAMGKMGCRLFLTDIDGDGLKKTVDVISDAGGKVCLARAFDVGDYQAMAAFAREVHEGYGSLDILVNVAGIALFSQVEDMRHSDWEKVIKVNLWGVIHGIECFVPEMIRAGRGGHIVSVSSTAGLIGLPWHAVYAGTKHALVGISEVLRYDLRKHNIDVSVICPGAVNTGLVQSVEIHANREVTEQTRALFLKIAITPEKVADIIIKSIRFRKFLVITSFDIKLFYFVKKYCFPLYHLIMLAMTRFMDKSLKR